MNRDIDQESFEPEDTNQPALNEEEGERDKSFEPGEIAPEPAKQPGVSGGAKKRSWTVPLVIFLVVISFVLGARGFRSSGETSSKTNKPPRGEKTSVISLRTPLSVPAVKNPPPKPVPKVHVKPIKPSSRTWRKKTRVSSVRLPDPAPKELLGKSGKVRPRVAKRGKKPAVPKVSKPASKKKPPKAIKKPEPRRKAAAAEKERLIDKEFEIRLAINDLLSRK